MQQSQLVKQVARATTLHEEFVARVLDEALRQIEAALFKGEQVILPRFGTFYLRTLPEGTVKNIQTGEPLKYGARKLAGFRAGPLLKRETQGEKRRGSRK